MSYVAPNPKFFENRLVGSGQCVAFVQEAAQTGHTCGWTQGRLVKGAQLERGTAIATFSNSGKYENDTNGNSHAAIYLWQDASGIRVYDQWTHVITKPDGTKEKIPHPVQERTIAFKPSKKAVNDGRNYYVIE